jgi:hypothetical protein
MDHAVPPPPEYLTASREAAQPLITSSLRLDSAQEVARPAPQWRARVLCDVCRRAIDSPGVIIVRGRTVVHVACDTRERGLR